jgi:hypothetical protein
MLDKNNLFSTLYYAINYSSSLYENDVKQKLLLPVNSMAAKTSIIIVPSIIITVTQYRMLTVKLPSIY